jgi:FemAB-related protein (PEP-CTERM system-associated)
MIIQTLTAQDCSAWDHYVEHSADGLPLQLTGWRDIFAQTNGYETFYLMACDGSQLVGVMPLFLVRSFLLGNTLTTPPGALCADSDGAAGALIEHGQTLAHQVGAKRLVLQDSRQAWPGELQTSSHHVHWLVDLREGEEKLWKGLDGNIRRQVRLAQRNGLTVAVDRSGDKLDDFYGLFSRFTHQAGTPVFGRDFLAAIIKTFPGRFNIVVVYHADQPIAAYFQLEMGGLMSGMWGAALPEFLSLRPVYLAYWTIISEAVAGGFDYLDMGRSPANSNAAKYKGQWGGVCRPVHQQVWSGQAKPAASVTQQLQTDGKMQWLMQLWPKIPLPLARYLGPKLRRHVPFA